MNDVAYGHAFHYSFTFTVQGDQTFGCQLNANGGAVQPGEVLGGSQSRSFRHAACSQGQATGYPITTSTGNFWHSFDDLVIPSRGFPLAMRRTYNANPGSTVPNGPFGDGWSFSYGMNLEVGTDAVTLVEEGGSRITFSGTGPSYTAAGRIIASLQRDTPSAGMYTLTRRAQETSVFNSSGQLVSQRDLNGYSTELTYLNGNLDKVTAYSDLAKTVGRTLSFSWVGSHIKTVTDANEPNKAARVVTFSYGSGDTGPDLTEVLDVSGGRTNFAYDANHRMTRMRLPNQFDPDLSIESDPEVVSNVYDTSGRVTSQTDQLQRTTSFDYTTVPGSTIVTEPATADAAGNPVSHVRRDTYNYGLLMSQTNGYNTPQAATWSYEYDPVSLGCTKVTDPNTHVWNATYDAAGNRTSTIDPLGRKTTWTYNAKNYPTSMTDPRGHLAGVDPVLYTTTLSYDDAPGVADGCSCRLTRQSRPLLNAAGTAVETTQVSQYRFGERGGTNSRGDVTTVVDPLSKEWKSDYDADGNPVKVIDPLGHTTTAVFDRWARMTSEVSPRGNLGASPSPDFRSQFTYDADNRLRTTSTANPPGAALTSSQTWDANRNLRTAVDGDGHETTYDYDAANQPTVVRRPDTTTTQSDYWNDGSLKAQRDGAGNPTSYFYDAHGRLTTATDPLGRATTYGYDPAGNQLSKQDHGGNCAASPKVGCTSYGYDIANHPKTITYSDEATANVTNIDYGAHGARTAMTEVTKGAAPLTSTSTWKWDSLNRLVQSKDVAGAAVGYAYDLRNQLTDITYPGQLTPVHRSYDAAGRMESIQDWLANTTSFGYDENDNLKTKTFPTGTAVVDTLVYDNADRLSGIDVKKLTLPVGGFSYNRTGGGLVSSVDSSGVPADDRTFAYTSRNQLCWSAPGSGSSCATPPSGATRYNYDPGDNLVEVATPGAPSSTRTYDIGHQLCWTGGGSGTCASPPTGATSFGYDARGNRTTESQRWATATFGYDGANRLSSTSVAPVASYLGTSGDSAVAADYDGDAKADHAVWRPSSGGWYITPSGGGSSTTQYWGREGDKAVPADYDGDTKADLAVWRQSSGGWYITPSSGAAATTQYLGSDGDSVVPADYDGDAKADIAVWRGANGAWYINTSTEGSKQEFWGLPGDVAVPADYDGDATADVAVWRPTSGGWYIRLSGGGLAQPYLGLNGDIPVPADYDGDGKADVAVWRSGSGTWYISSSTGESRKVYWGRDGDVPVPADYDGDRRADVAVWRSGGWWVTPSGRNAATYAYDGDGLRMSKTTAGTTTGFVWDVSGALPLLLGEKVGTETTNYIYGPDGSPLARITPSGAVSYYHQDQLGSTRLLTDATGSVTQTYTYDDYGKVKASSGSVVQPFGFAGEYTDAESGLQYLRARYYDPATGQFLTRDPLEPVTGTPYAYANNSPLNFTDPSGEIPLLAAAALAWGAFEFGSAVVDGFSTAKTLSDSCASGLDKLVSGGLFAAGVFMPGGGYSTGARAAKRAKAINLPAWKRVGVDIDHIASGHMVGGSRVSPLKDLFPGEWSTDQVEGAVRQAYRHSKRVTSQGPRTLVRGEAYGVPIEMWVNTDSRVIETAYPVWKR